MCRLRSYEVAYWKMKYGYIRVSTQKQYVDRQIKVMLAAEVERENIYIDYYTGASFERPEYQKLIKRLKKNDELFIDDLFRLGRDYKEIIKNWRFITSELQADIIVLDMPLLDTRQYKDLLGTLVSDIVLCMLSYCAQHSRENMLREQAAGISAAKARGVKFGRPRKITIEEFDMEHERVVLGISTPEDLMDEMDISRGTYYRYLKELERFRNNDE